MLLIQHFVSLTVEGHSIYIRNLPFSVTADQLETEFKKFGPIKPGGVQVRNNRVCLMDITYCSFITFWITILCIHITF